MEGTTFIDFRFAIGILIVGIFLLISFYLKKTKLKVYGNGILGAYTILLVLLITEATVSSFQLVDYLKVEAIILGSCSLAFLALLANLSTDQHINERAIKIRKKLLYKLPLLGGLLFYTAQHLFEITHFWDYFFVIHLFALPILLKRKSSKEYCAFLCFALIAVVFNHFEVVGSSVTSIIRNIFISFAILVLGKVILDLEKSKIKVMENVNE